MRPRPQLVAGARRPRSAGDPRQVDDAEFLRLRPPSDVRITTPDTWVDLDLGSGRVDRDIARAVRRRVRRFSQLAPHAGAITGMLRSQTAEAAAAGGRLVSLLSEPAGATILSASMTVSSAPALRPGEVLTAAGMAAELRARHGLAAPAARGPGALPARTGVPTPGFPTVTLVRLAQCGAARVAVIERAGPDLPACLLVEYHVPAPSSTARTVVSFSTPALSLAAEMAWVFDLVASSFHYVWREESSGRSAARMT